MPVRQLFDFVVDPVRPPARAPHACTGNIANRRTKQRLFSQPVRLGFSWEQVQRLPMRDSMRARVKAAELGGRKDGRTAQSPPLVGRARERLSARTPTRNKGGGAKPKHRPRREKKKNIDKREGEVMLEAEG